MKKIYALSLLLLSVFGRHAAQAQCTPVLANDSLQFITDNAVLCSAVSGNMLYLGGNFSTIGQNTGHFIGLDTASGKTINRGSYPRVNGVVYKVIDDGAGGWYVGGQFTTVGDSARNNLAQIDAAGHVTGFNPNADGAVKALCLNGGTLFAGGSFSNIGGIARQNIAAISAATGVPAAWNPGANGVVNVLYIYNNKLYAGGKFAVIGGQARNLVAALDTATGAVAAWNANSYGVMVNTITGNAGMLYLGGNFYTIGGASRQNLASLDTATAAAGSWAPTAYDSVNKIIIHGTSAYVAGAFQSVGSLTRYGLGEVSLTTGLATGFDPSPGTVQVMVSDMLLNGNILYIGGKFTQLGTTLRNNIAAIDITSGALTGWTANADAAVYTLGLSNGRLYAGGDFVMMGIKQRSHAAAIDMSADTVTVWDPSPNSAVQCMTIGPSSVFIAGQFSSAGGAGINSLAAVNLYTGHIVPGFSPNITYGYGVMNADITSAVYNNGAVYLCGNFDYMNGATREHIGAVDATTGMVTSWNPNSYGGSYTIGVPSLATDGASIFVGGAFSAYNIGGAIRSYLAAIDPVTGMATSWNPNPDGTVNTMVPQNGKLFVGGSFNNIGGVFAPRLAKVSLASGVADNWAPYPSGDVNVITPFQNIDFISGSFSSINATSRYGLTTVDTISNDPGAWDPAPDFSTVTNMQVYNDRLYIGGTFYTLGGSYAYHYFALYKIQAVADEITISGSSAVCAGTPVTYTAATNVTGGTCRWFVNGTAAGTGGSYTYTPANGDVVKCTGYIPAGSCYTTDSATSNSIIMTVTPNMVPAVHITGQPTVCAGIPVSYVAHTNIANATYSWHVSGVAGGTDSTYTYTPLNGDNITCTITVPAGCYTADSVVSDIYTMTVYPNADALTSTTASATTVCAGTAVSCVAHGIAGLHYQWKVNGANVGTDDSTYAYAPAYGDHIICVATPPAGCYVASPDSSAAIVMIVIADTTPVITITGDTTMCAGSSAAFTLTSNVAGATYHWYVNGTAMAATTGYSYTAGNGDIVMASLTTPAGCYAPAGDTSNLLHITVHANITPATTVHAAADTLCAGAAATITCTTNIAGATYHWLVNGLPVAATTGVYSYIPANGDAVTAIVDAPAGSCYTQAADTSNALTLIVNPVVTPVIVINGPGTAMPGGSVTVTATVLNAGATYLITWYRNGVVFNTSGVPTASYAKDTSAVDTITATIVSLSPGCYDTATSNTIYIYSVLAVNDVNGQHGITAYPNPFTDQINIKGLTINDEVTVYDAVGRKVYAGVISRNTNALLNMENLSAGVYLLHVADEAGNSKANIMLRKQ